MLAYRIPFTNTGRRFLLLVIPAKAGTPLLSFDVIPAEAGIQGLALAIR
jgi:hypothetical protein